MDDAWPEHLLARNHPVRQWSSRSDATWEVIRHDYLSGTPARDLCDRHDVALSTLRARAKEGGWRRADQVDSDLFPADADLWVADTAGHDPDDDPPAAGSAFEHDSWADLADRARFRLRRAIASGRAAEAASWMRVHERLRALAIAEAAEIAGALHSLDPEPDPAPARITDPLHDLVRQIGSLAEHAVQGAADDTGLDGLEAQIATLEARVAALGDTPRPADPDPGLDSLDSLDPVFSSSPAQDSDPPEQAPPPDRISLLRSRQRRLDHGLGVSDLDEALAALDGPSAGDGLSP